MTPPEKRLAHRTQVQPMGQQVPGHPITTLRVVGAALLLASLAVLAAPTPQPALANHPEVTVEEALAVMEEHGLDCLQPRLDEGLASWWCDRGMDCEFPDDGTECSSDGSVPTFQADVNEGPVGFAGITTVNALYGHSTDSPDPPPDARAWLSDLIALFCPAALAGATEWFDAPVAEADYSGGAGCTARLSLLGFSGSSGRYQLSFNQSHSSAPPSTAPDPCSLLTEADVETVLGVEAEPGRIDSVPFPPGPPYCTYGTAPYELRITTSAATESTIEDRAENLRAVEGQVVEEIDEKGLQALWVTCPTCENNSNRLSGPMEGGWLTIDFWPTDDAAQALRASLQAEQRDQAIELARIALGLGPIASIAPSISAEPAIEPSPAGGIGSGSSADPGQFAAPAAPGEFVASIATPAAVSVDPPVVLQSALLALAVIFLMPFPAQLFNSTVEEHRDEIRGWFAPVTRAFHAAGRGLDSFWRTPIGIGLFLVVSAVLYALLDPAFGLSPEALITLTGIAIGIIVVTVLFALPAILSHRRHGDRPVIEAIPGTLLVGIACVAISRLADFQPGYLYGLVIGLNFARQLDSRDEGRSGAAAAALMLTAAVLAWVGLGLLVEGGATGFVAAIVETVLAAVMVAGLEGVVFGLLPLRFLPGEPVYAWNRVVWGALLGIGLFAFFHVLINPASGYLSDTSRTPLLTVIGLLVGFGLLSVGFWAYFRYRPERHDAESPG